MNHPLIKISKIRIFYMGVCVVIIITNVYAYRAYSSTVPLVSTYAKFIYKSEITL